VRRLLGASLIAVDGRRFVVTEAGRALADRRRGGMFGQVDSMLTLLRRLPVVEKPWSTDPGELHSAAEAWRRQAEITSRPPSRQRRPG
jgi:hypothetical protein